MKARGGARAPSSRGPASSGEQLRRADGRLRRLVRELLRDLLRRRSDLFERVLLLLEVLLEERDDVVLAHRLGLRDQALVHRDLDMLGLRRRPEQHRVDQLVVDPLHQPLALGGDPVGRVRVVRAHLRADRLQRLLEVLDLPLGLLEVVVELLLQRHALRALLELAERRAHLPLGAERHGELVLEQLLRIVELCHLVPSIVDCPKSRPRAACRETQLPVQARNEVAEMALLSKSLFEPCAGVVSIPPSRLIPRRGGRTLRRTATGETSWNFKARLPGASAPCSYRQRSTAVW